MELSLRCLFLMLLCALFPAVVIRAQDDQSGFISLDCGSPEDTNYTDAITGIRYVSDTRFIDTGKSMSISPTNMDFYSSRQMVKVRSFPGGIRNCYTLRPAQGKFNKYLIRASFYHGEYDVKSSSNSSAVLLFDIHIDVHYWDTINITDASYDFIEKEIIYPSSSNIVHVCLVNKGLGTPFISALELRPFKNDMYTRAYDSLILFSRLDFGSTRGRIRYKDDIYDRIWEPSGLLSNRVNMSTATTVTEISTKLTVNTSTSREQVPSAVMSTAVKPLNFSHPLNFTWVTNNVYDWLHIYTYVAELEVLKVNQSREFVISINGFQLSRVVPKYLTAEYFSLVTFQRNRSRIEISLNKTEHSTLPPIINAVEIYGEREFLHLPMDEKDYSAIMGIKLMYRMTRNWQGDPCGPDSYVWIGLNCSHDGFNSPRIISLNLSSSGLTGSIAPSISNLTMLQTLDLSNNKLTGEVPAFFADLESLKILNLNGNNLDGPIPAKLLQKSQEGRLSLSMDACKISPCKKKNKVIVPVVASISALFVLLTSLAILWSIRRRRKQDASARNNDNALESNNKRFTYSDILNITNNFQKIIGQGGFGTVYHGCIDKTEVAVKILNASSSQGDKEFQAEANVLINVHHKNLTSMVGYFIEGANMGIIYEYMANGDLRSHLTDKNQKNAWSWRQRLQIAIDAALGLEYLHHGCKRPIIHRDVKCSNILLDDKFQAKLADFGLSRVFSAESGTHLTTGVAGTPGYLDPQYYMLNRLTEKSDVFSFGVVLLEIFTGRPAIQNGPDPIHVIHWVSTILEEGDVKDIVDPSLMGDFDVNSVVKAIKIAMACVDRDSTKRPTMSYVVIEIKDCLAMEMTRVESKPTDSIGYMSSVSKSSW